MNNINQFAVSLMIIFIGYICKRFGLITEKDGAVLSNTVLNITLPALIIQTISNVNIDPSLATLPVISLSYGIFIAFLAVYLFRKHDLGQRGELTMLAPGFNIGLFAYPFVETLWGHNALKYLAMFDIGNSFLVFVICNVLASLYSNSKNTFTLKDSLMKSFKSIPLIAYLLALAMNLAGLHLPNIILNVSSVISKANTPLSLLTLGVFFSFSFKQGYFKSILKVSAIRYVPGIALGLLLYNVLPFDPLLRIVLMACLILPPGLVVIPYSIKYNYDARFVGTYVNIANVVSFLLMCLISFIPIK